MDKVVVELLARKPEKNSCTWSAKKYIKRCIKKGLVEDTVLYYTKALIRFNEWGKNPQIRKIKRKKIKAYKNWMIQNYAPKTIKNELSVLRTFFNWCKKKKLIKNNPAENVKSPKVIIKNNAAKLTDVEAVINWLGDGLIECGCSSWCKQKMPCKNWKPIIYVDLFSKELTYSNDTKWNLAVLTKLRDLLMILLVYETAGRRGEIFTLSTKEMDNAIRNMKSGVAIATAWGKEGPSDLRFTAVTAQLWKIWKAVRPVKSSRALYSLQRSNVGNLWSKPGTMTKRFHTVCRQASVPIFAPQAVRSLKAQLVSQHKGQTTASGYLNHTNPTTIRHYDFAREDQINKAALITKPNMNLFK